MKLSIIYARPINQKGLKSSVTKIINKKSSELIEKLGFAGVLEIEIYGYINHRDYTITLSITDEADEIIVQVVGLKRNSRKTDFMVIDEIVYI